MMKYLRTALCALSILAACDGSPTPVAILATSDPARLYYHSGQDVILRGVVTDAAGEVIPDLEVRWTVEPADAASDATPQADPSATRFTLGGPGTATFTGCVGDEEHPLCDAIVLRVDDGMPSLELELPSPGAQLDDAAGIVVRGSVADRSMVRVYANGMPAEVDEMGRFEVAVPAQFGVNHLVVDASDGLTEASQVEMDVLWAETYTPAMAADGRPELTLDDGMALWLGQGFFDDGQPLDPSITPVTTRDLADILELVMGSLDVSGLVPDPVVDEPPNFNLRVTGVRLGEPYAELDVTEEGADVFLRLGAVSADTAGYLLIEETSLPLTGTVTASVVAYARLTISKESEEAEVSVELAELSVGIEEIDGAFSSAETTAVFQLAEGVLRATLEQAFLDAIRETVESSVPALLRDALTAVDGALANRTIPLEAEPFPAMEIRIDGRMRSIDTAFRSEMLATLRTTVGTGSPSVYPDSRGVPRFAVDAMSPAFFQGGSLALGVRLSMINGLLYSLWSSGMLSIDATPLLPDSISGLVSAARLNGRIQPLLRPARAGETDELLLTLGQLELDLTFMGEEVRYAVSLDAGVTITLTDNRLAMGIAETPTIRVWTLVPPSNERLLSPETVETLLLELWPNIRESITSGLAFDLPLPGLGDLGGLAPSLSTFTLEIESTEPIRMRGEVMVLDARLVGTLPE